MNIPALNRIDVGDASLPYLHYKGGASQIVFVHATGFMPWIWHPVVREFVPQCSVFVPFINDYRRCDPHTGGLSWDIIARDISVFCRKMRIHDPLIVGHSMGATVSALAVGKYGVRARGMILIEPIFLSGEYYTMDASVENHSLAAKSIKRRNHWKNEEDAWTYLKKNSFFFSWNEEVLRLYFKYGMQRLEKGDLTLTCSPKNEAAIFIGSRQIDPWPFLNKITCPVIIVEGANSEYKEFIDAQKMLSCLPQGQIKIVPDARHLIPMEKPQEIAQIVKGFLQLLDRSSSHN